MSASASHESAGPLAAPGGEGEPVGPAPAGAPAEPAAGEPARLTAWVRGEVQGVGFRWFTRAAALRIGGLVGFALNLADGRVQVVAEGAREECGLLLDWLRGEDTPGRVDGVTEIWDAPRGGYLGFAIR
ncbi:acylphosphatase [Streptomyces sp. NHF165]|nr:acylphosphatase [Streptomyces cacaoi]QHF96742.1 acylphosphatase [Streptomyces sp. NHF165]